MQKHPFKNSSILTEDLELLEAIKKDQLEKPRLQDVPIALAREARDTGEGTFPTYPANPEAVDLDIGSTNGGPGIVRITYPKSDPVGVYIHIHGGGFTFGRPWHQDWRMKKIADKVGCITASIEYRLTPENSWPACLDDCENAADWVINNCNSKFGVGKLIIGGESAGAHLSAATLLRLKKKNKIDQFVGALLTYGWFDANLTPSAANWGDEPLVLSTPLLNFFIKNLNLKNLSKNDPYLSPLHADLRELPEALFQCGTLDPLVDDTSFMAARWESAGNDATTVWYPGGVHGFDIFESEQAKHALNDVTNFLKSKFS